MRSARPGRRRVERGGGFTMVELLIAMLLMLLVSSALVGLVVPARRAFEAQLETSDAHQRLRVAIEAVTADLRLAGAGLPAGAPPAVMPYRIGRLDSDPDAGVFYRAGVISAIYVDSRDGEPVSRSYYLRTDRATSTPQLMRYDGLETDLPVVDRVVAFELTYFDEGGTPTDPAALQDGPWLTSEPDVGMFDADLLRVRRVRVRLRVEAARDRPAYELQSDVALRNAAAGE